MGHLAWHLIYWRLSRTCCSSWLQDRHALDLPTATPGCAPFPAPGVHINGYVTLPDGSKELWVAKRSSTKPTWPGKLDHIAAGGQPHGLGWDALHVSVWGRGARLKCPAPPAPAWQSADQV